MLTGLYCTGAESGGDRTQYNGVLPIIAFAIVASDYSRRDGAVLRLPVVLQIILLEDTLF